VEVNVMCWYCFRGSKCDVLILFQGK